MRSVPLLALAINVTIPEELRWTDSRRGQEFVPSGRRTAEWPDEACPGNRGLAVRGRRIHDSAVVAFGIEAPMASESHCPHCGGEFQVAKADSTRYLLCADCGLVRMLPFAALNPGSSLLDPLPRSTAV